jgi:hypothetical protein
MGGIKKISPVPKPLSTKVFPAMTGGMEIFLVPNCFFLPLFLGTLQINAYLCPKFCKINKKTRL